MLRYFLKKIRIFNASDDLHVATAILSLLYLEADGRPLNTLFKRCAPNRRVRHRIGSPLTGLRGLHRLIYRCALKPGGIYVAVGGSMPRILQYVMFGKWISRRYHKHIRVLGLKPNQGLAHLTDLVESGKIIAMIDGSYQLIDAIDAIQHFAAAKHKGKVVISMVSDTLSDD